MQPLAWREVVRAHHRRLEHAAFAVTAIVGLISLGFAVEAFASGGARDGIPAFPFVLFGVVGTMAAIGDVRVMRAGRRRGPARIARHLWRMSFALLIAALSFFLGQAQVIPAPLRKPVLLATPVLAVLVTMLYWLWRVRIRRSMQGLLGPSRPGGSVAPAEVRVPL